ncbi:MAG: SRPBCC family protein [Acidimicrobiales bacterium]|jgi:carbon monoxide dehydrogenase subunit G
MELIDEFEIPVPVAEAWAVLTDVEKIAPFIPAIELGEVGADGFKGVAKLKVGPVSVSYRGTVRVESLDSARHEIVLVAEGREVRGRGRATGRVTATLNDSGSGTTVKITSDFAVTGKLAELDVEQLAEVSADLVAEFAGNLESTVSTEVASDGDSPTPSPDETAAGEPVEPEEAAGKGKESLVRRLAPYMTVAGVLLIVRIVVYSLRRRRR